MNQHTTSHRLRGQPGAWIGWPTLVALLLQPSSTLAQPTERDPISSARRTVELPEPLRDADLPSSVLLTTSLLANQLDLSLLGAVPHGEATDRSLPLGLVAALERALEHNLGSQLQRVARDGTEARRRRARSVLLPSFELALEQRTDQLNFDASAFARFRPDPEPGELVENVSGFQFFDARFEARWRLFDRSAQLQLKAARALERASEAHERALRSSLILVAGNQYYRVALLERRLEINEQRFEQATAFRALVEDGLENGLRTSTEQLAAEIDTLSAERQIDLARGELEKARLRLARTIGLPIGQRFHLLDRVRYTPLGDLTLEDAVEQALRERGDVVALREELAGARAELAATRARRLPRIELEADWGEIGPTFDNRRSTYGFAAEAKLPIWRGGEITADRQRAVERVHTLELRLRALEAGVHYQVAEGLIDERTADRVVQLAQRAVSLARRRLEESRARFDAGVADSLEVLQATTALATAQGRELDALLAHRTAKGAIARALGLSERVILGVLRTETMETTERTATPGPSQSPAPVASDSAEATGLGEG